MCGGVRAGKKEVVGKPRSAVAARTHIAHHHTSSQPHNLNPYFTL
jgi:hypothetical protein